MKDGIGYRRRDSGQRSLSRSHGFLIFTVDQDDFDLRSITEAGYTIIRQMRIQDLAIIKADRLEHGTAQTLHDGSADLILQAMGIYDRAALKGLDDADDSYFVAIHRHFRAGCNVTAFFKSPGEAEAAHGGTLLFSPAKLVRSGLEHGAQTLV